MYHGCNAAQSIKIVNKIIIFPQYIKQFAQNNIRTIIDCVETDKNVLCRQVVYNTYRCAHRLCFSRTQIAIIMFYVKIKIESERSNHRSNNNNER